MYVCVSSGPKNLVFFLKQMQKNRTKNDQGEINRNKFA